MSFPISLYRYGSERGAMEGLRLGVTRHVPRGVRKEARQRLNYFDVWLPLLAPSAPLVSAYQSGRISFQKFTTRYRSEMKSPASRQVIELLAGCSFFQPISLGCFCKDETRCHRSLLQKLVLKEARTRRVGFISVHEQAGESVSQYTSPVCYDHLEDN